MFIDIFANCAPETVHSIVANQKTNSGDMAKE